MDRNYRPSLSSGIYGSYTAHHLVVDDDDNKMMNNVDDQIVTNENDFNWNQFNDDTKTESIIDQKAILSECKKHNFCILGNDVDDEKELLLTAQSIGISNENDLQIPSSIKSNSNYGNLRHKFGEQCNVFPMPSLNNKNNNDNVTKIISFTLNTDINEFCSNNKLDEFIQEISNITGINKEYIDCLCVNEGSSILWIKFNNLTQNGLQDMINTFVKPNTKTIKFIETFDMNINKTIDVNNGGKFKKMIHNFQTNNNNILQTNEINEWLKTNVTNLYPLIYNQLKYCHYDFEIIDCMVIDVQSRIDKFSKHSNWNNSKLLFHGTETTSYASIINNGFWVNAKTLGKWYGIGAYFTSFPVYSMLYYCMKMHTNIRLNDLCLTLIGSLVNTGNERQIYEERNDEPIPLQFDCNHVNVFGTGSKTFKPVSRSQLNDKVNQKDKIYDEYVIRDATRVLPRYLIKLKKINKVFIWRNTTFDQFPNAPIYEEITKNNVVYLCKDSESAVELIKLKKEYCNLYIISNSENGINFIQNIVMNKYGINANKILIFCNINNQKNCQWADSLNVEVTNNDKRVKEWVNDPTSKPKPTIDELKLRLCAVMGGISFKEWNQQTKMNVIQNADKMIQRFNKMIDCLKDEEQKQMFKQMKEFVQKLPKK